MLLLTFTTLLTASSLPNFKVCELDKHRVELTETGCIYAQLPLNYEKPESETIKVFVRKFPAQTDVNGSLWLLAGGPGEAGAAFYNRINWFRSSFPDFDIYVPDHRGTGASSKICPQETINSEQGIQLVGSEWGACFSHIYQNPEYVKSFSISNAALDVATLINHYGKGDNYLYGVSYGTQLAVRIMSQDKVKLRGVVLDSLVPHQLDDNFDLSNRSVVVDNVGDKLLTQFTDDPNEIKKKIRTIQSRHAKLSELDASLPKISLSQLLGNFLDIPTISRTIPSIVNALDKGDIKPLKQAIKDAETWLASISGNYSNEGMSLMLVQTITSSENNLRPEKTKQQVVIQEKELSFTSPLPYLIAENTLPTYQKDKWFGYVPNANTPTLVLHGNLDPKTHIDGAKAHIKKFQGEYPPEFIEYKGASHAIIYSEFAMQASSDITKFVIKTRTTK